MTIARETTITIDRQREITIRVHDEGAVTLSLEDPHTVAIVEIPAAQLAELQAAIAGEHTDVRMLLDGLEVATIAELKRLVDTGREVEALAASALRLAGYSPDTLEPLRDATAGEIAGEPDGVLEAMAAGDLEVTEQTRHIAQAELDYRKARR